MTAAPVAAQDDEEDAAVLDRVQVTGSRIARIDAEGATPVVTISREDIDATGFQSVADVLRNNSFNVAGSLREDSGNTAQGQATINMRGIGSNRTLVLLNGRRLPGSPVLDGQTQNLNAIPFAAVDRIEILYDGASAIYGSDAIGGVINIILRDDFDGVEATVRRQYSDREGGDERLYSIVGGVSSDRGSITYALEKSERDIIWARDREFFASANIDSPLWSDTRGLSTASRNFLTAESGYSEMRPMTSSGDCTVFGRAHYGPYDDQGDTVCGYDFTEIMAETASLDTTDIFINADYHINDDVRFWARGQHSEVESFGRYAPAAGGFFAPVALEERVLDDGTVLTPISAGDYILYRFDNTGPGRDTWQVDTMNDLQLGFDGYLTDTIQWEVGYQHNNYRMNEWGDGYVNTMGSAGGMEAGWDPRDPDQSQYADLVADMRENSNRRAEMETNRLDAGVSIEGPMMAGGPVGFFVGTEYREEEYYDQTQAQAEAGNIIGTAGGSSAGERDIFALYGEASLPIHETFNLDFALRYDDYSDFGSNVSGRLSGRWQPMDPVMVRGSYGTGFRAPSLDQLYQSPSQGFAFGRDIANCMGGTISEVSGSPTFGDDIANCLTLPQQQHQTFFGNNPELDAETSEQLNLGVVVDFTDWIGGQSLTASLDYYWIEISDTITGIGVQDILWLNFLENMDLAQGLEYNSPGGQPTPHVSRPTNYEDFDTSGLDLNVAYTHDAGAAGMFSVNWALSYVLEYNTRFTIVSDKQDYTKLTVNEWRTDMTLGWNLGDHSVDWHIWHVPGRCESTTLDMTTLDDLSLQAECVQRDGSDVKIGSFTHHNVSYSYRTPWDGTVTLGVNNVADKMPPLASDGQSFSKDLYPFVGRQYVLQYTQRF